MTHPIPHADVIVVGAGFAGLYTVIHAARRGLTVIGIEAGADVGGTWYWNRYPGARCDVESIDYSYSFDDELQQEWRWSERYATQPEILRYLSHVADRFDARRRFRFATRVVAAEWDDGDAQRWTVATDAGDRISASWLVMATGSLSTPLLPDIPGRESFGGEVLMTAAWPHEPVDLHGKRVGVIGTGSSGIQSIPLIADQAAELVVYQRTANFSVPALNRELDDDEWTHALEEYPHRRQVSWDSLAGSPWTAHDVPYEEADEQERARVFEDRWTRGGVLFGKAFPRQTVDIEVNDAARRFFEGKLAEIVRDPQTLDDLTPRDHAIGTKRICTDSGYFDTFNRPHVTLVNLRRDPIIEITAEGVRTESGFRPLEVIVFATGFDALTGALTSIDIRGRSGRLLRDEWKGGVVTNLGMAVPGFPNLIMLNGPGSPTVLTNMAIGSEQQGDFALRLVDHTIAHGYTSVETREDAARAWTDDIAVRASRTLFAGARSWYTGANVPGKAAGFLPFIGGFRPYIHACDRVADAGYEGFVFSVVATEPAPASA
ncbi:flavin-containing monooxygenase [uncultured Microbacterium sp.]|uniref:flavin-containing monooxygenase n=1 Tax=uncultured Microbacterium sp. TaxID=191216 RepID=UPI0035C9884E